MGKYGEVATRATDSMLKCRYANPDDAWRAAAREVFPTSAASQSKNCPKGAYLGLCEAGLVKGVASGDYTSSQRNKAYALEAVRLLRRKPELAKEPGAANALWRLVLKGADKKPNSQMDVVLALWEAGQIVDR